MIMDTYLRALDLATEAHQGQTRKKSGDPYIIHPIRVAALVGWAGRHVLMPAAILHDTVEDSSVTLEDIDRQFGQFGPMMMSVIDHLTKRKDEDKNTYLQRCIDNPSAAVIKMADRIDNLRDAASTIPKKKLERYLDGTMFLIEILNDCCHPDDLLYSLLIKTEKEIRRAHLQ